MYGFEVLPKVTMKISVVWNVTPCCLVDVYRLGRKVCPEGKEVRKNFRMSIERWERKWLKNLTESLYIKRGNEKFWV